MATNTVTSPSKYKSCDGNLPIVSTRPSHSLCSQGVPIAAVLSVTDWCVSKLRFVQVNLHANQYWVNSEATK